MRYKLLYINSNGDIIKINNQITWSQITWRSVDIPVWGIAEKIFKRGKIIKHPDYKVQKFTGVFGTFSHRTIPNTIKHFKTLEEAMMYVSMQE